VRAGIVTYLFAGLTLVASLVTGVVMARALGPEGRGVAFALVTVAQLAGFVFSMGVAQSLSFFIARDPRDGPSLLSTWLMLLVPLAAGGIALAQLLLPVIFATDGEEAIATGRWFMLTISLVIALELNYGLLLGTHDFTIYNALRFAQPALTAVGFLLLWPLDALTVDSALIAASASTCLVLAVGLGRAIRRIGLGPVAFRFGLTTLWFGVRGQGATVATNVNTRLDVAMLPAFVSAASVGLYSVATSVALIVYQLSNTFAGLVIPAAAGDAERGRQKVIGSFWAAVAVAGALALLLGLLARPLLGLVYGDDFRDAAEPLVLLLPGAVLFAGSAILSAGIYAEGRPFTATAAQLLGMVITVVGLSVFLRSGGVTAAALVSSAAYATVFLASAVAYTSVTGMPWRELVPSRGGVRALLGSG
jgi:O-antigen/teichoic acid export membrane protein